ncbi:MAG: nitroreductase family protein [Nitrososphaeria archaeon]
MSLEVFYKRVSVRRYKPDPVSDDLVTKILEAALQSPSAGNIQPWHLYVIKDKGLKRKIATSALNQTFIIEAPVVLVVCAVPERSASVYGKRGKQLYCIQDTAAVTMSILLASTMLGLGSCWVGAFDEHLLRATLQIPKEFAPVAIVPIGYPQVSTRKPPKMDVAKVCTYLP